MSNGQTGAIMILNGALAERKPRWSGEQGMHLILEGAVSNWEMQQVELRICQKRRM